MIGAVKTLEDMRQVLGWYPLARIRDTDDGPPAHRVGWEVSDLMMRFGFLEDEPSLIYFHLVSSHLDLPTSGRMLHRVVEQNDEDLLDTIWFSVNARDCWQPSTV